ncbi:MAG: tRNA (adenosine(37)-N6)-threonylcarbamoyltransferase complex dimerization subunit type 1 TsaB [Nitrosospira sp.]|nr:tRNA (adenosine(37)-N6)-threonylcarbamoyltransferase complex dimerization subunit type 1 TsaB [Nitrosospira sp.]MDN5881878.1 tRNA (adenosine(37)-N6)-threonylcarbamoyltransferase complex dimerization subunit type 1 TsaB [Nitrosospira sp.]MDN5934950.1 tRNA (adenosine(37)-N6)-threonylcarbamoyltransferase complex dimerization subunit type 1 TsaB [Nitrosospira sp.]
MKILALDTSTEYCSIALLLDGEVLSREIFAERRHSELILPMLQRLLDESGLTLARLDGIAFGAGPGSFTGLRIACGVTQGLAFGADLPVMGVCTLEALAQEAGNGNVITALDARMNEIYHAAYTKAVDGWQTVSGPALCLPQHAPLMPGCNWTGCGSGFSMHAEALRTRYDGSVSRIISGLRPRARAIVELAAPGFAKGLGLDPADAAPLYIRNKVALKEGER